MVTSLCFIPYNGGTETRYLVSASNDCLVIFYKYDARTNDFADFPQKFNERIKAGVKIQCSCFSPGGNLVALGDTHQNVRLYRVAEGGVEKLYEIAAHSEKVYFVFEFI